MSIVLHHGDCLEVMRSLPDNSVDAVITDPPYGIRYNPSGGNRNAKRGNFARILGDDSEFNPQHLLNFAPIVALCGANHFASRLPDASRWLIWDKRDGTKSNDMADCEIVWTNAKGPARLFSHRWMGMIRASERGIPRVHPTQKPVALMEWAMDQVGIPEGATILDPYMGSGSTGVACIRTNRNFIGIEKDAEYFKIAERRIYETRPDLDQKGQTASEPESQLTLAL